MNIPNLLSGLRIACVPLILAVFYSGLDDARALAVAVFVVASLTDWFDGWLARRWNQTSPFGAFIDPVADKLMVAAVVVMLVQDVPSWWMVLPAVVIVSREILVSALREWMAGTGARAKVAVGQLGKWKTALQMVAIIVLLLAGGGPPSSALFIAGLVLLYLSALLALVSMGQYLAAAWPVLRA